MQVAISITAHSSDDLLFIKLIYLLDGEKSFSPSSFLVWGAEIGRFIFLITAAAFEDADAPLAGS